MFTVSDICVLQTKLISKIPCLLCIWIVLMKCIFMQKKEFFLWIWKLRIDFFFYSSSYSWMTGHTNQWWRRFERTKTFYLANKNAAALNSGRCWDQQGVCVVGRLSREGPFLWDKSVCVFSQTSIHTLAISPIINPSSITPCLHPSIHTCIHFWDVLHGWKWTETVVSKGETNFCPDVMSRPALCDITKGLFLLRKQKEAKGGLFQFLCGDHRQNIATLSFENISTVDSSTIKVLLKTRSHSPDSLAFHLLLKACNSLYRVC